MDLELMFSSIISLRTANWENRMKLFKDLLVLVMAYLFFIAITVICIFLQYFVHISLLPHSARIIPLTTLRLYHHMPLIKLILLQLHHHTSFIKLTSIISLYFNYSMLQTNYISQFNHILQFSHNITPFSHSFVLSSDHTFSDSIGLSTFISNTHCHISLNCRLEQHVGYLEIIASLRRHQN